MKQDNSRAYTILALFGILPVIWLALLIAPSLAGGLPEIIKAFPAAMDNPFHMLKRVLARAGIPKVRFHDLRHTFATIALQNGVDIKTVSSILGHFSAGFTLDTYAHVTTAAQKEAADIMGNILDASTSC